jgi:D-alanyl-D-alanine carboxypeptidase (penicillin-binding protein 5/6)
MKTLALLITLVLHTTGLWSHLSSTAKARLTSTATTGRPAATVPAPGLARPAAIGPLPVRVAADTIDISAASALAFDTASGTVLYAKNSTDRHPIASVTKMVTALVILSRHAPTDTVTIPALPTYQPADERIGLTPGEVYTVGDLTQATLINSANDAADALALWDAGTQAKFATQMNAKMAEWGIAGTRFSNPTGLIDDGNYATADALGKIAGLLLTSPYVRQTILRTDATITSQAGRAIPLTTTNKLLATGQFYGIKTGYTPAAGECFVGLTRVDGHEVITVVLGAGDRFGATQELVNWIGSHWQWL